jgi:MinD-like ATPase involved in chromosome partitioning or flagellar assembly
MSSPVYFDDALPIFSNLVQQQWGAEALSKNQFLRDVDGKLTFIVLDDLKSSEDRKALADAITPQMGSYVDPEFSVATAEELFDDRLADLSSSRPIGISHQKFNGVVNLVDRRLVGADWLRTPADPVDGPARLVFASIKGGVGRSTALCVVAAHLASRGKRVLAIDLDLEAPGLGNMLLAPASLPEFGLLDYLVEKHVGIIDDDFFSDLIGPSWLGAHVGRIDVIPAIGKRSLASPGNALAKIARAYLTSIDSENNEIIGFSEKISMLLSRVAKPVDYDVVLIDSRAGLHETAAAAVIGLGAEVLLFGIDQPQTISGYELLLSHLATLPHTENDWRDRLNIVHAKAAINTSASNNFTEKMKLMMQNYLWPETEVETIPENLSELSDEFETEWEEPDGPIKIAEVSSSASTMIILDSQRFQNFDPLSNQGVLEEKVYTEIFSEFLDGIDRILKINE